MSITAISITGYEGPATLVHGPAPEPVPGPGQVAIDVEYAGANYVELLFSRGVAAVPLPFVPGIEAAGRVRALGRGEASLGPGQRVAALTITLGGGYGGVAVTDARLVVPIPDGLDLSLAAAVPSNTTTAFIALEEVARLRTGESVLVHAAVGGLGSQFGQVARLLGAERVVGVVGSAQKTALARELGYDEVWLREDLARQAPDQFDLVVDPVGGPGRLRSLELLRLGGRILAVGNASQAPGVLVDSNELWFQGKGVLGVNLAALAAADPALVGRYLARAVAAVHEGDVLVHVSRIEPLSAAPAVLSDLESGSTQGKIVLRHGHPAD